MTEGTQGTEANANNGTSAAAAGAAEKEAETKTAESATDSQLKTIQTDLEKERGKSQRLFAELTNFKKQLERFASIDPDKVKATEEENEILKREAAESSPEKMKEWKKAQEDRIKANADAERKSWEDKHAAQDKTIKDLQTERRKLLITDKIVRDHGLKIAPGGQRHFMRDADEALDFEDGEEVVRDEAGNIRYSKPGVHMTHAEWVDDHLRVNTILAASTYNGGGQTAGNKAATSGQASKTLTLPTNWGVMSADAKADWMRENPESKSLFSR